MSIRSAPFGRPQPRIVVGAGWTLSRSDGRQQHLWRQFGLVEPAPGASRQFLRVGRRHQEDGGAGKPDTDEPAGFDSTHAGHVHVHEDQSEPVLLERLERLLATRCDCGDMQTVGQIDDRSSVPAVRGLIVHHEDGDRRASHPSTIARTSPSIDGGTTSREGGQHD
jgi:hypothetical protein